MNSPEPLRARAEALHLHGLLAHWSEVAAQDWLTPLLAWEEQERRALKNWLLDRLGTHHRPHEADRVAAQVPQRTAPERRVQADVSRAD